MAGKAIRADGADHPALADRVYAGLLAEIIDGRLASGSRIKERDVSARFDVSRIPVRQAIHRLRGEGFVVTEPNRGAVVRTVSTADITDLFDARLCMEPFAARLAAGRVVDGSADPGRLQKWLAADAAGPDRVSTAGGGSSMGGGLSPMLAFHAEIVRLSGNRLLVDCLRPMLGRMEWIFRLTRDVRDQHTEHEQICAAIVAGRGDLAAHLSYTHIELGRPPILQALQAFMRD